MKKNTKSLYLVGTMTLIFVFLAIPGLATISMHSAELVDMTTSNTAGEGGDPERGDASDDGRYIVFESEGENLVADDTNTEPDIFVRDTVTNTTTRVSVADNEDESNEASRKAAVSADGRYVVFHSFANNLVIGDTNNTSDIFVRDTVTNTTTRVSVADNEDESNSGSENPAISADGRYVAFQSYSNNLVANDTNSIQDIFVRDTVTNTTTRVSVDSDGNETNSSSQNILPSISGDGRYIAFESSASNLVVDDTNNMSDVFLRDTVTNTTTRVSVDSDGNETDANSGAVEISNDGSRLVFLAESTNLVADDTNGSIDAFLRDTVTNTTTRVSVDSDGNEANAGTLIAKISANGRYIAMTTQATNLDGSYSGGTYYGVLHDTDTGSTDLITKSDSSVMGQINVLVWINDDASIIYGWTSANLVAADTNAEDASVFNLYKLTFGAQTSEPVNTGTSGVTSQLASTGQGQLVLLEIGAVVAIATISILRYNRFAFTR